MQQVIHIHVEAPRKPAVGQACNGCGVCCLAEPCPVGMLISRRRHGACKALAWTSVEQRYRCSLMQGTAPAAAGWRGWLRRLLGRWAARLISAGSGCDATLETLPR